jgi:cyclopropane fatty-acyl-phospholipid synthase-like methyltransferase
VFDDPARDAWQKPDQVIAALRLPEDAKIADIGAGTGYFAVRIARAYPNATVYAVDIEPNLLEHMRARAEREKLPNVRPVLAAPDDARLVERVDLVLIVDTYHHIDGRPAYFRRLSGMLRHDAEIAVIDYRKDSPFGPPPQHRIAEDGVIAEMREAGFEVARRHDFLPHQYFLVFTRRP